MALRLGWPVVMTRGFMVPYQVCGASAAVARVECSPTLACTQYDFA